MSVDWVEIPLDPATFAGAVVGLVASGPRGLLALGQARTDRHPIAWTSSDGRTWTRHDLPPSTFGDGVPETAAQLASGWVAVGYHATADGALRDIWTSSDGAAWTRDPSATGRGLDEVRALTGSGQSAVMVASVAGGRQVLLSSHDGRVWAETPDLDVTLGRSAYVLDAVATASGFVAVGFVGAERAIWRSTDGHDWVRSDLPDPALPREIRFQRVFRTAEGLLVMGYGGRSFGGSGGSVWVSPDGVAWTPSPILDQVLGAPGTVLALDGGNLGIPGDGRDGGQGNPVAWAGTGPWVGVDTPTPEPLDWGRQAVVLNGQALLIADKAADGSIGAWLGGLHVSDPAVASPTASEPGPGASIEPFPSVLPPVGRPVGSGTLLDWHTLRSASLLNDGRELVISGVARLGDALLAYGSSGYDSRFWLATDKSHWRLLPLSPAMRGTQVSGVAEVNGGVVAVGQVLSAEGLGSPAVWMSVDGQAWKRVRIPGDAGPGQLSDVVAGPEGLVAVGSSDDGSGNPGSIVWTSSDGSRWTPATTFETDGAPTQLSAVARGEAGYVAVGAAHPNEGGSRGVAWTSPDGRTWTRADAGTAFASVGDPALGEGSVSIADVAAGDVIPGGPAFVAVGTEQGRFTPEGMIFSSPDGRRWARAPADPGLAGVEFVSVIAWAGGLAAAANVYSLGGAHPMIWVSSDGVVWTPLDGADLTRGGSGDLRDAYMSDLIAEGSGLVAVGGSSTPFEPFQATVWAGAGPGEIVADNVCPAVIDSVSDLAAMTRADRAACIGARPVTVKALVRAELDECTDSGPRELSQCGSLALVAPIEGGPDQLQIKIDRTLVDTFGADGFTPWALTLRADVVGTTCEPTPVWNGVLYEPPESVHLQCRALLRLVAQEPLKTR